MWSVIGPERRTETLSSSAPARQFEGKAMFSLKTANIISTNPACNLLLQLNKQPCSTCLLAQLWKPTALIYALPLTRPPHIPFFEVYSCSGMAPWVLEACPWPCFLLVLFHSDELSSHQQSEDNMAYWVTSTKGLSEKTLSGSVGPREPGFATDRQHGRIPSQPCPSLWPPPLVPIVSISLGRFTNFSEVWLPHQ